MDFIHTYFNMKIGALKLLFGTIKNAWDDGVGLAVVLMILWTMFCTIGGTLLLPIDIIWCAVLWHKHQEAREVMEEITDELTLN